MPVPSRAATIRLYSANTCVYPASIRQFPANGHQFLASIRQFPANIRGVRSSFPGFPCLPPSDPSPHLSPSGRGGNSWRGRAAPLAGDSRTAA
jgi:hypothetical protein